MVEHDGFHPVDPADQGGNQDVGGGAGRRDPAPVQHDEPVAAGGRDVDVVQGGEHAHAAGRQGPDQLHGGQLGVHVQVVGGLVEQQHLGFLGEGLGQLDPLALAAGQGGVPAAGEGFHPHCA
ncbi:hypothetical protein AHIS1636_03310 [Arthrobacter mangrovi]|uniref:Uncharacterized protein n=1 Tax=Arthrobacter mangrovi TaxID=2966350 RepID=A0ABQ5MPJ3_9MICC|nr:hypothetical protein AHIS1636_03310 [Arthrobacter mangrovi]